MGKCILIFKVKGNVIDSVKAVESFALAGKQNTLGYYNICFQNEYELNT